MTKDKLLESIECDLFYFLIGSLISADNLIDIPTCETALCKVEELEDISQQFSNEELSNQKIIKAIDYIKRAKEIILRDLETLKNKKI